jgi:hypothetical protein
MGDPSTPDGKAKLEKQSPLFSANKIKTPLLVIQGANDPRVKKAEADQIVSALRDLGTPVEYMCAPDEGHGFRNPENNMAMIAYAEKFLAKHLGGRYQESLKPELAAKQKAIMVDIATVKVAGQAASSSALPPLVADLKEGSYNYAFTMAAGGQSMKMEMKRDIKKENGKWAVTDAIKTPMGEMVEQSTLDPKSLACLTRKIKQGPATIDLTYTPTEVNGSADMGTGQAKPVTIKLEHPIVIDGAGSDLVIGRLPLKENFSAVIEMVDVMSAQVKKYEIKYLGTEKVTVPAGSFDTYKVSMSQVDGGEKSTFWISSSDRNMIKVEAFVPQAGNATMTAELK